FLKAYLNFSDTGDETEMFSRYGTRMDAKDQELRLNKNSANHPWVKPVYNSLLELQECLIRVINHKPEDLIKSLRDLRDINSPNLQADIVKFETAITRKDARTAILISFPLREALQEQFF